jgi:hypothetical protein|tara:strand:+ start:679 stop:1080 length:402 start_codon:yes stop_codon:yes gene_type:complete
MARRGRPNKTQAILNQLRNKPITIKDKSNFGEFILPNNSGDHQRSIKRNTPINDIDIANKKYVDDNAGVLNVVSSDPASSTEGTLILNNTDNKIKVWYDSQWQELHTLTTQTRILLETGDVILLETGDQILAE